MKSLRCERTDKEPSVTVMKSLRYKRADKEPSVTVLGNSIRMLSSIFWRSLLVSSKNHYITLNVRPRRRLSLSAIKSNECISS
jgi:hypothetical protein